MRASARAKRNNNNNNNSNVEAGAKRVRLHVTSLTSRRVKFKGLRAGAERARVFLQLAGLPCCGANNLAAESRTSASKAADGASQVCLATNARLQQQHSSRHDNLLKLLCGPLARARCSSLARASGANFARCPCAQYATNKPAQAAQWARQELRASKQAPTGSAGFPNARTPSLAYAAQVAPSRARGASSRIPESAAGVGARVGLWLNQASARSRPLVTY